ncbi:MAG TPA: GTPase [Acidimicrobiia bacterium]|nr:GTPase [Acidimicrobiia bacterium]
MIQLLDLLDRLVSSSAEHLPSDQFTLLAQTAKKLRHRRAYSGVLVGMAGSTGSGKSSLLNAIVNEQVSDPGATRPTTSRPLVVVPPTVASRLERMWAELDIEDIVPRETPGSLVLVDLPDVDSVAADHRRQVNDLLTIIDVVVWVTDPEKYRDRIMHDQFFRRLIAHEHSYVFVLNQVDRLDQGELAIVTEDLEWALRRDGFSGPEVVTTAADPPAGPPMGVEDLVDAILAKAEAVGSGEGRMRIEIKRILEIIGPSLAPVGFSDRWDAVRARAAADWKRQPGAALQELGAFVEALSEEAPELSVSLEVLGEPPAEEIERHLDSTLGRALREGLRPRARSRALATELELALSEEV